MPAPDLSFQRPVLREPIPSSCFTSHNRPVGGGSENKTMSTSHRLNIEASGAYTYRPPSPPHMYIPSTLDIRCTVLNPSHNLAGNPAHQETLLEILQNSHAAATPSKDWEYASRRQAQAILPFIYLGPSSAARDLEVLKAEGITLLLVIRDASMVQSKFLSGEKTASILGIEAAAIDVTGNMQLIAEFPRTIELINDHLVRVHQYHRTTNSGPSMGKVLVFCESGNERSATVVAAYLMHMYGVDVVEALQYLQTQRFCVAFDDDLKLLLRSYGDILMARRTVRRDNEKLDQMPRQRDSSTARTKRGRDDIEDLQGDSEMGMDSMQRDDEDRFGRRAAFAPFRDVGGGTF